MLSTHSLHLFTAESLHILQGKDESWSVGAPQQYHIHVHGDMYIFLDLIGYFFCGLEHCISETHAKLFSTIHHIQLISQIHTAVEFEIIPPYHRIKIHQRS